MNLTKRKNVMLIGALGLTLLFVACGDKEVSENIASPILTITENPSPSEIAEEITEEISPEVDTYEWLISQFYDDANVPEAARGKFTEALHGEKEAQEWIYEYERQHDDLSWQVVEIVYSYDLVRTEDLCLYRIAMLYYYGNDNINFTQDKIKAYEWVKLSAIKGNADASLCAGDMARYGEGVSADEQAAFEFYLLAHNLTPDVFTYERLGDCYLEGIGIVADRKMAFNYYKESALMGYSASLYKLSAFADEEDINLTALYKAASSQDYSGGYWAMVYGSIDDNAAGNTKRNLTNKLLDIWENGSDAASLNLQNSVISNNFFTHEFVTALTQTVYTYSYHAFAEEYGLRTNRTYEDAQTIQFAPNDTSEPRYDNWEYPAERSLKQEGCQFYEYDFDGCGEDEIGIPIHSGAGGAFMADGFGVFKKNIDELYEYFSFGPDCTLRDAMRIMQFDGKIYFIVNLFDDTGHSPQNIMAYTIDKTGHGQTLTIKSDNYVLQRVLTYTDEAFAVGYDALLSDVGQQCRDAVTATKQQQLFSPVNEKQLTINEDDDWWSNSCGGYYGEVARHDIFFAADIVNSGVEKVIHKGRLITQSKYYFDYNWFQVYENQDGLTNSAVSVLAPSFNDGYYGLHSGGNVYDMLPVVNDVVQFWTHKYDGVTYCVTLQRYGLLYTLQIYLVQNGETKLVSKSLFFDEAQGIDISFS